MAAEHSVFRMTLPEVQAFVAELEEKYRTWTLLPPAPLPPSPGHLLALADLAKIRASLQRSIVHLDRLLVEWDEAQQK